MRADATMIFTGSFVPAHFRDFVDHRAARLDLDVHVRDAGPARFSVRVSGEADLVDAFEMACSLGPLDCVVRDVVRLGPDDRTGGAAGHE